MAAKIYISGDIEPGFWGASLETTRAQFDLSEDKDGAEVYIRSNGGDAFEGLAIHDYLNTLDVPVTTIAEGYVASAASIIFIAAPRKRRKMMKNATLMIHNPWTYAGGEAGDLEAVAEQLRQLEDRLIEMYANATGNSKKQIREWMNEEKTFTAEEAVAEGFAGSIVESTQAKATVQIMNLSDRLAQLLGKTQAQTVEAAPVAAPVSPETDKIAELQAQLEALKAEKEKTEAEKAELERVATEAITAVETIQSAQQELAARLAAIESAPTAAPRPQAPVTMGVQPKQNPYKLTPEQLAEYNQIKTQIKKQISA